MFRQLLVARSVNKRFDVKTGRFPDLRIIVYRCLPRVIQWRSSGKPSDYSDEFAQDLHLFPYYPEKHLRHLSVFVFSGIITRKKKHINIVSTGKKSISPPGGSFDRTLFALYDSMQKVILAYRKPVRIRHCVSATVISTRRTSKNGLQPLGQLGRRSLRL